MREFLISQIGGLKANRLTKGKVVLFLPEHEKHELSLLFYYYVLKKRSYDCFYLGQSVPMKDLRSFVVETRPDFIVTSLIAEITAKDIQKLFADLTQFVESERIYAGGHQLLKHKLEIPENLHIIQSFEDVNLNFK